jgi:pyrroloquinoline quinone biosynthesis protein B
VVDTEAAQMWLIDATPDLPAQWGSLRAEWPDARLAGVFLTHLHMGHYIGLAHFGPESAAADNVPVHASAEAAGFLLRNQPWASLAAQGHIAIRRLAAGVAVQLSGQLALEPVRVPHRPHPEPTFAFLLRGPRRSLFYCPDIDAWDRWEESLADYLHREGVGIALLDGTFWSADELPGRSIQDVPHPFALDTAARARSSGCDVRIIHMNHTNPLWEDGVERAQLRAMGIEVGSELDKWEL